eukprot:6930528-Prymnesium_polylepis.1
MTDAAWGAETCALVRVGDDNHATRGHAEGQRSVQRDRIARLVAHYGGLVLVRILLVLQQLQHPIFGNKQLLCGARELDQRGGSAPRLLAKAVQRAHSEDELGGCVGLRHVALCYAQLTQERHTAAAIRISTGLQEEQRTAERRGLARQHKARGRSQERHARAAICTAHDARLARDRGELAQHGLLALLGDTLDERALATQFDEPQRVVARISDDQLATGQQRHRGW